MPRSLLRCCKEVYAEPALGRQRAVGRDRAARGRDACHAAFHAHGGHRGGRPAAVSRSIPGSGCAISAIASPRTSWFHRRRLDSMQLHIRHETRYRYERPVKYSVQSLHLTPRRDASQRALTWTHLRARAAPRAGRRLRQHLAPAHHRGAAPRNSHRGAAAWSRPPTPRGARTTGPLSPLAYLAPTALTAPERGAAGIRERRTSNGLNDPRERARGAGRGGVHRGALQAGHQRRAGQRGGGLQERRRRVPGPCACLHRLGAFGRHAGALCERLPLHRR